MIKKFNEYLLNKKGMTLVEVLTAMSILTLMIFCFAPLMLSYFQTIDISGKKMQRIYNDTSNLEVLIGKNAISGNYSVSVDTVPMKLTSPEAVVEVGDTKKTYAAATIETNVTAYGLTSGGVFEKDHLGNPSDNGTVDVSTGQSTFFTDKSGHASGINIFPSSITDDFKIAYITIFSADINFVLSQCNFVATNSNGGDIALTKGVDYDIEYHPDAKPTQKNMLLLTVYGGDTKITFETSPLVFIHLGKRYEIQVDAPTMIMVGEKAPDNNYYYYVSRGELDKDGSLLIHRRKMYTERDPISGTSVTLNSAMNDVEWVPAESADNYATEYGRSDKYGYYVMCGDNGQVRRFWKNQTTGNYYWGGDWTYYTDMSFDKVDKSYSANNQLTYSTSVSYKFNFRASAGSSGYNLAQNSGNYLQSVNTSTVTANPTNAGFYGSDGKLFYYQTKDKVSSAPAYSQIVNNAAGYQNWANYIKHHQSTSWYQFTNEVRNGYYTLNGLSVGTNPITLTSVDAMALTGSGGAYYSTTDFKSDGGFSSGHYLYSNVSADTTNLHPTSSYTLYCGYIPATMDMWTTKSSPNASFNGSMTQDSGGSFTNISTPFALRTDKSIKATETYPLWKATLGITPILTTGSTLDIGTGQFVWYKQHSGGVFGWKFPHEHVSYYPYQNISYAMSGTFYDSSTPSSALGAYYPNVVEGVSYNTMDGKQQYMTNGKVVDITMAYMSHPFAVHIGANPSDDTAYDQSNDKGNRVLYWNNMRETVTYLDSASTYVPSGEKDIPVSLMVGYVMGGMAEFGDNNIYVNTIMSNGIVMMRAGKLELSTQKSAISKTEEYIALDKDGYKLAEESNVFHQFYYLNSRTKSSDGQEPYKDPLGGIASNHVGNMYGAEYWQNNRHIDYVSINGGKPDNPNDDNTGNYNYLRCHPLANTKVTCVTWGASWASNPVAMWGTENGTLLSWMCEKIDDDNDKVTINDDSKSYYYNDRSIVAEFQSYRWIINVCGVGGGGHVLGEAKHFATKSSDWKATIGTSNSKDLTNGHTSAIKFERNNINDVYKEFFDSCSRIRGGDDWKNYGFISTLENINDVSYSDDIWIAVGDQSSQAPSTFCGPTKGTDLSGKTIEAYTGDGRIASYVNVCYWIDTNASANHKQAADNRNYQWKAVKISNTPYCNIVQINNVNGMWIATGYLDQDMDGEYDDGEPARMFWTYDPTLSCDQDGGWSDKVKLYEGKNELGKGNDAFKLMGGINSVATRDNA